MKVGFIGFGEVASLLTRRLLTRRLYDNTVEVISSTEGRSDETKKLAEDSLATIIDTYEEVAESCEIVISTTTPGEALDVAKKYAPLVDGIFLDLNNISPKTTLEMANIFEDIPNCNSSYSENYSNNTSYDITDEKTCTFIKGSIMGSIKSPETLICVSGEYADDLDVLNDYGLNIKVIGENVQDSAYIKMLRSMYTKGVTALLYEVFGLSEDMGLTKELFESLINTEGEHFEEQTKSRISSLTKTHERKSQEMDEILEFLKENTDEKEFKKDFNLIKATRNQFKDIK